MSTVTEAVVQSIQHVSISKRRALIMYDVYNLPLNRALSIGYASGNWFGALMVGAYGGGA